MYSLEYLDLNEHANEIQDIYEMLMSSIRDENEDLFNHINMKVYEMKYGKNISEEMANDWVDRMIPKARWTMDETNDAKRKMNYNLDDVSFFIVANMMYSDNYDLVKDNEELALRLAYNWLNDSDVTKDKLYNYWKYVYCGE